MPIHAPICFFLVFLIAFDPINEKEYHRHHKHRQLSTVVNYAFNKETIKQKRKCGKLFINQNHPRRRIEIKFCM